MSTRLVESYTDDFDGSPAAESVKFAVDGRWYVIDLSESNAAEMRRVLAPYITAGYRLHNGDTRRPGRAALDLMSSGEPPEGSERARIRGRSTARIHESGRPYDTLVVRTWGNRAGYKMPLRGPLPEAVLRAYFASSSAPPWSPPSGSGVQWEGQVEQRASEG